MTPSPDRERVRLNTGDSDAMDLFPSEQELTPPQAPPAPTAPLIQASGDRDFAPIVEMPVSADRELPRLDGAIEPEPVPPLVIAAAAAAVVLIVLMGVAVFFQRQRLNPEVVVAAPPVLEMPSTTDRLTPLATVRIGEIKIPAAEHAAALPAAPPAGGRPTAKAEDGKAKGPKTPDTKPAGPAASRATSNKTTARPPTPQTSARGVNAPRTGSARPQRGPSSAAVVPPLALDLTQLKIAPGIADAAQLGERTASAAEKPADRTPAATPTGPAGTPAPRPEPPAPAPTSSDLIRGVLQQYATALSRLDVAQTRSVWPSADAAMLRRAYEQLVSQRVELGSCDVRAGDRFGSAVCAGRVTIVPRVGRRTEMTESRTWIFELARQFGNWTISSVKAQ